MTPINLPPLLLDNERFRAVMREREQWPAQACSTPAVIRSAIKPAMLEALAGPDGWLNTAQPLQNLANLPTRAWPSLLRQLHQELCSSTQLRPMARILSKTTLLPDPFLMQGGLWYASHPLPASQPQHPVTRLYTVLRLDLVLQGEADVSVDGKNLDSLPAGSALLAESEALIEYEADGSLCLWTELYYSPDVCCCRKREAGERSPQ